MTGRLVYVLAGPEDGKRADFVKALRDRVARESGGPPEMHKLYAQESSVPELLSLARNGSLFADARIIQYVGAEAIKGKEDVSAIVEYVQAPARDAVLLLVTSEYAVDAKIENATGRDAKQTFFELFENEKARWLRDFFSREEIAIDDEAIDTILDLVENDTMSLRAECSRISLFYPRGSKVSSAELEKYLAHTRVEDVFGLFERMVASGADHALETLESILANRDGNGVQVMSGLLWSIRRLLSFHRACEAGENEEKALLMSGLRGKKAQALYRKARSRYSLRDCERAVALAADYDVRLRSMGSAYERTLLYLFVYSVMTGRDAIVPVESPLL